jgi:preprotein translocase subunit YajC
MGSNILVLFGIVLLRMAYRLQKKIERKKAREMVESLNNPGKE